MDALELRRDPGGSRPAGIGRSRQARAATWPPTAAEVTHACHKDTLHLVEVTMQSRRLHLLDGGGNRLGLLRLALTGTSHASRFAPRSYEYHTIIYNINNIFNYVPQRTATVGGLPSQPGCPRRGGPAVRGPAVPLRPPGPEASGEISQCLTACDTTSTQCRHRPINGATRPCGSGTRIRNLKGDRPAGAPWRAGPSRRFLFGNPLVRLPPESGSEG